jgi:hypothetical protein
MKLDCIRATFALFLFFVLFYFIIFFLLIRCSSSGWSILSFGIGISLKVVHVGICLEAHAEVCSKCEP